MPQHRRKGPLGARFDGVQGVTELLEAQAVSRRNTGLGSKTRFPSACASGFEAIGDTPSAGKPEAQAEGMRAAARRRPAVSPLASQWWAEQNQTPASPWREPWKCGAGSKKQPCPSARASGFEATGRTRRG